MKIHKTLMVVLSVLLLSATVFAQEKEMTKEEWQNEINRLTEKKAALTTELNALKQEVADLKATSEKLQSYDDCMKELYEMVGATKADVDNFGKQVAALEKKIDAKESPKADRQAELDALKKNKISALPQFFDKVHNQLQRKLDAWVEPPKEINYTVVKGDCLWNIAKKKEHYDNPFAWPMIYKANRDQIKNPDLIYPKQVFKIPNLTEEEKAKYDKIRRNYKPAPPAQSAQ
ncbi:LysM domain protein [Melioribacter roseus P3M-2]|jgi:nucleoid-associated protein YgaU|uniref:LysM domain protein n=1 Tax=Melioribacter roseus (strain DSM 23840 / JCM 17771 / VKM B-2668 / P3M-2) TaxID=1191523 RepID=I7A6L9_MELRP|nr:LysM peptidoglycan-binding domain-containing protein [Melioribacter roseus]AFN75526.1 LysM domain protein [Melioribacter roseus P3M-2]